MASITNLPSPVPSASAGSGASSGSGSGAQSLVASDLEELDIREIQLLDVVGQGTYGTVKRAIWRDNVVAVKIIEGEMARKAFMVEFFQLSRVRHDNIITLYGACTKTTPICLVMEYAECGSLHKALHCYPKLAYKAAHAMSWMLQCADGVEYLHSFKPKALVHRDLKPLNLLLIDQGRKLKICDFGTACNLQTNMTNNKGSAQWMAPEVFEGSKYSEKCDVFSWGIMLWEVLTRRIPFAEVGGTSYSVMWAVHSGQRPPLIQNCPKPLEILMTRSWDKLPDKRPSMNEIVKIMSQLMRLFKGADEPLVEVEHDERPAGLSGETEPYSLTNLTASDMTVGTAVPGENKEPSSAAYGAVESMVTLPAVSRNAWEERNAAILKSAPASSAGSEEDLFASSERAAAAEMVKASGTDHVRVHRRTGSDTGYSARSSVKPVASSVSVENADPSVNKKTSASDGSRLTLPSGSSVSGDNAPSGGMDSDRLTPSALETPANAADGSLVYLALDAQFQPLRPFPGSRESSLVFLEHCQLAEEYIKIQEEITLLLKRKQDLIAELSNNIKEAHQTSRYQEYQQLLQEKAQMQELQRTLKADLDAARRQRKAKN